MSASSDRILQRECEVTIVPSGDKVKLPKDTKVTITHRLGGNFTVTSSLGMFRIAGKDADAIGETPTSQNIVKNEIHSGPPNEEEIWKQLKTVYDPEIPVNIVDLGLVYSTDIKEIEKDKYSVNISITLTAPGCGMGPAIAADAEERILNVPGVSEAKAEIVWDPPWTQDMISEEGKMQLGLI